MWWISRPLRNWHTIYFIWIGMTLHTANFSNGKCTSSVFSRLGFVKYVRHSVTIPLLIRTKFTRISTSSGIHAIHVAIMNTRFMKCSQLEIPWSLLCKVLRVLLLCCTQLLQYRGWRVRRDQILNSTSLTRPLSWGISWNSRVIPTRPNMLMKVKYCIKQVLNILRDKVENKYLSIFKSDW